MGDAHAIHSLILLRRTYEAPLLYKLGQDHDYDFVDGAVPWPAARGIKETYGDQEYFTYGQENAPSIVSALSDLVEYMVSEGPFDAVLGFSQGATLLATLIALQKRKVPNGLTELGSKIPPIKCAIFFSGGLPLDCTALEQGVMQELMPAEGHDLINIPTANIWAGNDIDYPEMGSALSGLCGDEDHEEYVHSAGHSIPSASSQDLDPMVRCIKRTIDRAM